MASVLRVLKNVASVASENEFLLLKLQISKSGRGGIIADHR